VLEDEVAVLDQLERRDEHATENAVDEDGLLHAFTCPFGSADACGAVHYRPTAGSATLVFVVSAPPDQRGQTALFDPLIPGERTINVKPETLS
jgi:hypothetical protein